MDKIKFKERNKTEKNKTFLVFKQMKYALYTCLVLVFLVVTEHGLHSAKRVPVAAAVAGNLIRGLRARVHNDCHFIKWTPHLCKCIDTCRLLYKRVHCLLAGIGNSEDDARDV